MSEGKRIDFECDNGYHCSTPCPEDGTVKIGSCACQDCQYNKKTNKDENWIICSFDRTHNVQGEKTCEPEQAEPDHDCDNCKYEDLSYNDAPCNTCTEYQNWEPKEPETAGADGRGAILIEAHNTINGERQDQYGNPEDSFREIAERWERYLLALGWEPPACAYPDNPLDAADVAHMMIEFKLARETSAPKRDNLLDLCGYAAIKADILSTNEKD